MKTEYKNKSKHGGIYQIMNLSNKRIYIGSTKNFKERKRQHLAKLRAGKHPNYFLQRDFNKCGEEVFLFEVLEVKTNKTERIKSEQEFLDKFFDKQKKCYNLCPLAQSSEGRKWSESSKKEHLNFGKSITKQIQIPDWERSIQAKQEKK